MKISVSSGSVDKSSWSPIDCHSNMGVASGSTAEKVDVASEHTDKNI